MIDSRKKLQEWNKQTNHVISDEENGDRAESELIDENRNVDDVDHEVRMPPKPGDLRRLADFLREVTIVQRFETKSEIDNS